MFFLKKYIKISFSLLLFFLWLNLPAQKINSKSIAKMIEKSPEQEKSFTGFAVYDLKEKKNGS